MSVDDNLSTTGSTYQLNSEQRRLIKELERKITKTTDYDRMNDLINDFCELFDLIPTSKLNRLHKIDGYKFYKRSNQTYFSKKSNATKLSINELRAEVDRVNSGLAELGDTLTELSKILMEKGIIHLID
jgi:hypothetical protein